MQINDQYSNLMSVMTEVFVDNNLNVAYDDKSNRLYTVKDTTKGMDTQRFEEISRKIINGAYNTNVLFDTTAIDLTHLNIGMSVIVQKSPTSRVYLEKMKNIFALLNLCCIKSEIDPLITLCQSETSKCVAIFQECQEQKKLLTSFSNLPRESAIILERVTAIEARAKQVIKHHGKGVAVLEMAQLIATANNSTPDKDAAQNLSLVTQIEGNLLKKMRELEAGLDSLESISNQYSKKMCGAEILPIDLSKTPFELKSIARPKKIAHQLEYEKLLSKLGPTPDGRTHDYVDYQRRLIFGFAYGRRNLTADLKHPTRLELPTLKQILEGVHPVIHLMYITQLLDTLITEKENQAGNKEYIEALKSLRTDLTRSLSFEIPYFSATKDTDLPQVVSEIVKEMSGELIKMKAGEKIFVPTGFRGHATLLVLEKKEDGTIIPTFYNTGGGIPHHLIKGLRLPQSWDKVNASFGMFPLTITYPPIDISNPEGAKMISDLISDLYNSRFTGEAKDLYQTLQKHLGRGVTGSVEHVQITGNCSFEVLLKGIRDHLGSKLNYNEFKKDLLTDIKKNFSEITDAMEPLVNEWEGSDRIELFRLHRILLRDIDTQIWTANRIVEEEHNKGFFSSLMETLYY